MCVLTYLQGGHPEDKIQDLISDVYNRWRRIKEVQFTLSYRAVNMVQVTNVVVQTDLQISIDLGYLTSKTRDIRYDPALFSAAIWRHKKIGGSCLVFRNGKLNCNGNRSIPQAKKRIRQYARFIQKLGYHVIMKKIEVITISAVYQCTSRLDFSKLHKFLGASHEPEICNYALLKRKKVQYNCFHTGKVVMTGIRNINIIYPTLLELELCTTD